MVQPSCFYAIVAVLAARTAAQVSSGSSDTFYFMNQYMFHAGNVPSSDRCGVNCKGLCESGMHKGIRKSALSGMTDGVPFANSEQYCTEACVAHSIKTTMEGYTGWSRHLNGQKQGMYVQKVMAEYCSRGTCKDGESLQQQKADIQKHDHYREGELWGYPAEASGWPSTCETPSYYCAQFCENVYHDTTEPLGEHPGADTNWRGNRNQCKANCKDNWSNVKEVFDAQCACIQKHSAPAYPPHLLQGSSGVEEVDVGSFMQVSVEL
jgi:hypothetical protein